MPELRDVFEMTTKQIRSDPGSWRDLERRQRVAARRTRLGAFAVAAAIALAALVLVLAARTGPETPLPVGTASPTLTVDPAEAAETVATNFLRAYGAFDAEEAMSYVADGADLSTLFESQVSPDVEGLSLQLSMLEAMGWEQRITSCETEAFDPDYYVDCTFEFHAIRSEEIGRGPFTGSAFYFTVRDGAIVRAASNWNIRTFSPRMWEPFAAWISSTYPEDFEVMYVEDGRNFRITERSIRLWERRTREYVTAMGGPG